MVSEQSVATCTRRSALLGSISTLWGCRAKPPRRGERFDTVLSGFEFVGDFPAGDWTLIDAIPHRVLPFPSRWLPRRRYVFHTDMKVTVEELATQVLPTGLRTAGAEVIWAPRSGDDMAVPNMGNPLWSIDFRQGAFVGNLHGRLDGARYRALRGGRGFGHDAAIDDLILMFRN
jgi:hypothetical protein